MFTLLLTLFCYKIVIFYLKSDFRYIHFMPNRKQEHSNSGNIFTSVKSGMHLCRYSSKDLFRYNINGVWRPRVCARALPLGSRMKLCHMLSRAPWSLKIFFILFKSFSYFNKADSFKYLLFKFVFIKSNFYLFCSLKNLLNLSCCSRKVNYKFWSIKTITFVYLHPSFQIKVLFSVGTFEVPRGWIET